MGRRKQKKKAEYVLVDPDEFGPNIISFFCRGNYEQSKAGILRLKIT